MEALELEVPSWVPCDPTMPTPFVKIGRLEVQKWEQNKIAEERAIKALELESHPTIQPRQVERRCDRTGWLEVQK